MYTLNLILIGCDALRRPELRPILQGQRAYIELEAAAVDEVITAGLHDPSEPRLVIMAIEPRDNLTSIAHLRRAFPGWPILALLPADADRSRLVAAIRAGATQLALEPLDPADVAQVFDVIRQQFHASRPAAKLLAIAGVVGGCGATTLAVNLAFELAEVHQRRVVLLDLSSQLGMVASYLNLRPRYTTQDLLSDPALLTDESFADALTPVTPRLFALPGPDVRRVAEASRFEFIEQLLMRARQAAEIVIADVPATGDERYYDILSAVDQVLLVGAQTVPVLHALHLVQEQLAARHDGTAVSVVINRFRPQLPGLGEYELRKLFPALPLEFIPDDPIGVPMSVNMGRPLRTQAPQSTALAAIDHLARSILGLHEPARARTGVLPSWLWPWGGSPTTRRDE